MYFLACMAPERYELPRATADRIHTARAAGRRAVAVGTTTVRTLESAAADGRLGGGTGEAGLFIQPGHRFQIVDALLTNFHLPRTPLLALVAAFAGWELVREAYAEAVRQCYRFYSFGDAMRQSGPRRCPTTRVTDALGSGPIARARPSAR